MPEGASGRAAASDSRLSPAAGELEVVDEDRLCR